MGGFLHGNLLDQVFTMPGEQPGQFHDDLSWCYGAVQGVSRTFSLTISALEEPMADEICVAYLLCRVADTIEDAGEIPPDDASQLLNLYSQALDPAADTSVGDFRTAVGPWIPATPDEDWTVVANAPRILDTFEALPKASQAIIRPSVRELTEGLAMFIDRYAAERGLRIQTFDELERYCWYAAGTVGEFVTDLIARDGAFTVTDSVREQARAFSLLLQLVNVTKDVHKDYHEENNVYIPLEVLAAHDLSPGDIQHRTDGERFEPVIEQMIERAEGYLDGAQAWLEAVPRVRGYTPAAGGVPFLLAIGTLRELSRRPDAVVFEGSVKVSRAEVNAVLAQFGGETEPSLGALRKTIRQTPLHQA